MEEHDRSPKRCQICTSNTDIMNHGDNPFAEGGLMVRSVVANRAIIMKILKSKPVIKMLKQTAKTMAIIIIDETFRKKR